ncbi:lisH domain-containing protein C1711.05-like [Lathyrus oleraceus]|uniref:lisH domain-containing protein C1711.05-like n=1 Tax=Pisum sativum TaxID=3888 RepID=UPI0021D2E70A|nr:lisH domain-containing protein C1711.05-like [Pisum sativum]
MANTNERDNYNAKPHVIDGEKFDYWKDKIESFFLGYDANLWDMVTNGYELPIFAIGIPIQRSRMGDDQKRDFKSHLKIRTILLNVISYNEYEKITNKETPKDIFDSLKMTYKGNNQVKETKSLALIQKNDCPKLKKDSSRKESFKKNSFKANKKGLMAIWDNSESEAPESDSEEEQENVAFMATTSRSSSETESDSEEKGVTELTLPTFYEALVNFLESSASRFKKLSDKSITSEKPSEEATEKAEREAIEKVAEEVAEKVAAEATTKEKVEKEAEAAQKVESEKATEVTLTQGESSTNDLAPWSLEL